MNKYNLLLLGFVMTFMFSCSQEQVADPAMPEIESLTLKNYPAIAFSLRKDSIPETFVNDETLPVAARNERLKFELAAEKYTKLELQVDGSAAKTLESDTFSVLGHDHFVLRLTSKSKIEKVYKVVIQILHPAAPEFTALDVNINPSGICPLAGVLSASSNQPVKISYTIKGQDGDDYIQTSEAFAPSGRLNIFGLYPNFTNRLIIKIENESGISASREVLIKTDTIPENMLQSDEIFVNDADYSALTTKFILLFPVRTNGVMPVPQKSYPVIIDAHGKVRWYMKHPIGNNTIMKPMRNGHWLVSDDTKLTETDLLGNIFNITELPFSLHHDFEELPDGSIIYLADNKLQNNTIEDKVYRIAFPSGVLMDQINLYDVLDPSRPWLPNHNDPKDWLHSNSIFYHQSDNSIVISNRHQSTVLKMGLDNKDIKWIFSDTTYWAPNFKSYLLTPTGGNFEYAYGQHSVIYDPYRPNTLVLFDNGNFRSYTNPLQAANSYSRIVEYEIDDQLRTVSQTYEFGRQYGSMLFAPYVGNVQCITPEKFFICYGGILKDVNNHPLNLIDRDGTSNLMSGKNQVRLFEVDRAQNVTLDLSIKVNDHSLIGFRSYRAYKIDL
jgi:arylsulfate sulfotransferase